MHELPQHQNQDRIRVAHISTVHPRTDTRIRLKQLASLTKLNWLKTYNFVADGLGNSQEGDLTVIDVGPLKHGRIHRILAGNYRMLRIIRSIRPRIIHFHDPELIFMGIVAKVIGYTVIYDVHEDYPAQIRSKSYIAPLLRPFLAAATNVLERTLACAFDSIVVTTDLIGERFPPHKRVIIQNYALSDEFVHVSNTPYIDRQSAVAYVGGISKLRGIVEIVEALEKTNKHSELSLNLAGPFHPSSLGSEVADHPGWKHVNYHGHVDRRSMAGMLANSLAGLILFHPAPNHTNNQPNKMFEYMSAGLPIIASDFPKWRALIEKWECGIVVDPTDVEAISSAFKWLLDNPVRAAQMGRNGRAAMESHFNWRQEEIKLRTLYDNLLRV